MNIESITSFPNKTDLITEFSPVVREKIEEERKMGKIQKIHDPFYDLISYLQNFYYRLFIELTNAAEKLRKQIQNKGRCPI